MTQTIQDVKTYALRCTYLGITAEIENVPAGTMNDAFGPFQELDTNFASLNPVGDKVWKWSGHQMIDLYGGFASTNPLEWRGGAATETGICSEGLGAVGRDRETFDNLCALLAAAGGEPLRMLGENGEQTALESEADWGATFDWDGINGDTLKMLDSAEWEVEEDGFDSEALLEIIKDSGSIDSESNDASELTDAIKEAAESNSYIRIAEGGDFIHDLIKDDDLHTLLYDVEDWADLLNDSELVQCVTIEGRDSFGQTDRAAFWFVQQSQKQALLDELAATEEVFAARIEAQYRDGGMGQGRELQSEAEFDQFAESGFDFVIFEGEVFTKADRDGQGDWRLYRRSDDGTWSEC